MSDKAYYPTNVRVLRCLKFEGSVFAKSGSLSSMRRLHGSKPQAVTVLPPWCSRRLKTYDRFGGSRTTSSAVRIRRNPHPRTLAVERVKWLEATASSKH